MSITLLHGDCFDEMPRLAAKSIDMVLADLPYGTTNCAWDTELDLQRLWSEYRRICRGPVVLFAQTPPPSLWRRILKAVLGGKA